MKRIIFVSRQRGVSLWLIVLGLLVLGGCEITQPINEAALETSLEVVNQAIDEGKLISCFTGIDENREAKKRLVIKEGGCSTFETEEELKDFCVTGVATVAKCDSYVKVTDASGDVYYDMEGGIAAEIEEGECLVSVECEEGAEGGETVEGEESEAEDETEETEEGEGEEEESEVEEGEEESEGETEGGEAEESE